MKKFFKAEVDINDFNITSSLQHENMKQKIMDLEIFKQKTLVHDKEETSEVFRDGEETLSLNQIIVKNEKEIENKLF